MKEENRLVITSGGEVILNDKRIDHCFGVDIKIDPDILEVTLHLSVSEINVEYGII